MKFNEVVDEKSTNIIINCILSTNNKKNKIK